MKGLKEKIHKLSEEYEQFLKSVNLIEKKQKLSELEGKTLDPNLWADQQNAKKLLQQFSDLKTEIEDIENLGQEIELFNQMISQDEESKNISKDVKEAQKKLNNLNLKMFLSGPYDDHNAIFSIHAGQGGVEAMDWSSMLARMYQRYFEKKDWKFRILDSTAGEEAGIKSVTYLVEGFYAYGYLKHESGTHRLVRQSPFNADNLRQTSFALVEVLPELEDVEMGDIKIDDEDLEIQFFHASSQGGQNVQKVSTAVRLTHKPTGIVVTAQSERFQEQNRKYALNLLKSKLWALEQKKAEQEKKQIKGEYQPASWGTQIRSYVLHPYKMVKDLRTEVETGNTEAVLDGDLDEFIEAEVRSL